MAEDMRHVQENMQSLSATPARSFQTASVPVTQQPYAPQIPAPQTHLPPPPPPAYTMPTPVPVTAPVRLTPVDRAHANAPIAKEYGSDPYRESIE